ncbi:hypothetical protein ACFX2J_014229 [Malus domestica]
MVPVLNEVGPVDAYIDSLPPGYRFVPTDDELILHYLMRKVLNEQLPINRFRIVNLYDHHPRDLTGDYNLIRESEWYFFTSRRRKYPRGGRPCRAADNGYWKATGKPDDIKDDNGQVIGSKRTLDYYEGKQGKGTKTDWKMHEYKLNKETAPSNQIDGTNMKLDDCVLCKIYKNSRIKKDGKNNDDNAPQSTIRTDQGAILPAPTNTVTSHAFPDQSIQHPYLFTGESSGTTSSIVNKHCVTSTSTTPAYYEQHYFQNQTWSDHPGPIHNCNNQIPPPREPFSSQFPLPNSMEHQIGAGWESVNGMPVVDSSSIRLLPHVREYERELKAMRNNEGQGTW